MKDKMWKFIITYKNYKGTVITDSIWVEATDIFEAWDKISRWQTAYVVYRGEVTFSQTTRDI